MLLFDLDGTLVDSADLILESYRHTMRTHFGEVPPDSVWLQTLGTPLRHAFRRFVDTPEEVQRLTDTYLEFNLAKHEELTQYSQNASRRPQARLHRSSAAAPARRMPAVDLRILPSVSR